MKKQEKMGLLILIVVAIAIILTLVIISNRKEIHNEVEENKVVEEFVQVLKDGTKLNTSTKLKETKKLDNLEIGNIQLTNKNGQSVLLADVKNTGSMETQVMLINIVLLDENGTEIATVPGIISPLKVGESTQLNTSMQQDYTGIYDFRVVKK